MVYHVRIDSVNSREYFKKKLILLIYVDSYIIILKCDKNSTKCLLK